MRAADRATTSVSVSFPGQLRHRLAPLLNVAPLHLLSQVARDDELLVTAQLLGSPVQHELAVRENVAPLRDLQREMDVLLDEQHGAASSFA